MRETFVNACDENEAEDLVEGQIASGDHHHMIDAYRDDMQAEPVMSMRLPQRQQRRRTDLLSRKSDRGTVGR